MPRCRIQCVGEPLLRGVIPEQRLGQPQRLVSLDEPAALESVPLPPGVVRWRVWQPIQREYRLPNQVLEAVVKEPAQRIAVWIWEHGLGPMRFEPLGVPEVPRWYARDDHRKLQRISVGRLPDPVQEGLPDLFRLRRVQAYREHLDLERVVGPDARLLSPAIVEETLAVEAHKLTDEAPIRIIGRRLDR